MHPDAQVVRFQQGLVGMRVNCIDVELFPAQLRLHHLEDLREPLALGTRAGVEVFGRDAQAGLRGIDLYRDVDQRIPALDLVAHDIVVQQRGVPVALPLAGAGSKRSAAAFPPMKQREREFQKRIALDRRGARPVGEIRLAGAAYAYSQLRVLRRARRADTRDGQIPGQPRRDIVRRAPKHHVRQQTRRLQERIADTVRKFQGKVGIRAAQENIHVQRDSIVPVGTDQPVLCFAQTGDDHQQVALGTVAIGGTAVDDFLELSGKNIIVALGYAIPLHGREGPVGKLGRKTPIELRLLLVAEAGVVAQICQIVSRKYGAPAVDGPQEVGKEAEIPPLQSVVVVYRGGETALERQPWQVSRTSLSHGHGSLIAIRRGDHQFPDVLGPGLPLVGELCMGGGRHKGQQSREDQTIRHDVGIL